MRGIILTNMMLAAAPRQLRVGDPRIISLIRHWLKAGIMEDGEIHINTDGTPAGRTDQRTAEHLYLHYVLDLWLTKVVKTQLQGEAYLVRYINDFVICFQYRSDAIHVPQVLSKRLAKCCQGCSFCRILGCR